jgi:Arylsulfotransferase (ASST)/TAT (twin-arginine translocation) pathway signal sequence
MSVSEPVERSRISRRQLLKAAGAVAVAGGVGGAADLLRGLVADPVLGAGIPPAPAAVRTFRSRPDLRPPGVATAGSGTAPGYLLIGPGAAHGSQAGPLIVDDRGSPVWFRPMTDGRWATNFRVQSYGGEPVLTWWEGKVTNQGYGQGVVVIVDSSYRELARIRGGNGRAIDMHELQLTPEGTALVTCYPEIVPADLSSIGGARDGTVFESILQEIEISSGRVVFEWRSLKHVPVSDSYRRPGGTCDYLHANSIDVLPDGDLLVSGRHTWALYKLNRHSGAVVWRLGGKRSDFALEADAAFSWQHDARHHGDGIITLFDDGSNGPLHTEPESRGLKLAVDVKRRTVRMAKSYLHPSPLTASSMGSVQLLPDGHALVGWGAEPYVSEFTGPGKLIADARLAGGQQSYRGYRLPWRGLPSTKPAIAVHRAPQTGRPTLYVSWNGATEVHRWEVRSGATAGTLRPVRTAARTGFETAIALDSADGLAAVAALDGTGRRIATSRAIRV